MRLPAPHACLLAGLLAAATGPRLFADEAPVAGDLALTVVTGDTVEFVLPATDDLTDPFDLECILTGGPDHGTVELLYPAFYPSLSTDRSYTADQGFIGTDSFTYIVNDGTQTSPPGTVTVTVVANTTPQAHDQVVGGARDQSLPTTQLAWTDPDDQQPTFTVVNDVDHGTLDLNAVTGRFVYTPQPGWTGIDTFTWRLHDGHVPSNVATCTIVIRCPPADRTRVVRLAAADAAGGIETGARGSQLTLPVYEEVALEHVIDDLCPGLPMVIGFFEAPVMTD